MDSNSDEEKYYASEDTEDEEEPRPPLGQSSISQPPSPEFSASSSEVDDDGKGNTTWKWTKKPFFHLLDLAIVNSYILLSLCGWKKISHRDFWLTLIREMLAQFGHGPRPCKPVGRPVSASNKSEDWTHVTLSTGLVTVTWNSSVACSARVMTWTVMFKCVKCDVTLCVDWNCFEDYHTKNNLWDIFSSVFCANSLTTV